MLRMLVLSLLLVLSPTMSIAGQTGFDFGGDKYVAGDNPTISAPVAHDAFAAGNNVSSEAPISGNAHLVGMNVTSGAAVTGDLYAAGFSVNVTAPVTGSVTIAGNNLSVKAPATIGGNIRLAGADVTLAAPVAGSALVSARSLTLSTTIGGDLSFYGDELTFGPDAKVAGTLSIRAPKPIAVPASVASPDRVKYETIANADIVSQTGNTAANLVNGFWPTAGATLLWWVLLFVLGAALIALAPRRYGELEAVSATRPWRNLGIGVLAFAAALGFVPAAAFTIVGIVLLPLILLLIVVVCVLGYIAGTYFAALRIAVTLTPINNNGKRIGVLGAALVVAGLLALIPLLGWLISFGLTLFGIGVAVVAWLDRPASSEMRLAAH